MNRFLFASAFIGTTALAAPVAIAEQQNTCGPRSQIVDQLGSEFKERQQAVGYVNDKAVLELFVSSKGTWTLIATGTDGSSCLLSAGKDWDEANIVKGLDTSFHPTSSSN
jgi:hypothetical protein